MKPKKVCEISLKFQPSNTITTHPHSFKTITRFSLYFPSFSPLLKLIIIFLFKKLMKTSIQDWMKIISKAKREPPMIQVHFWKSRRREMKVDSKLGGQWNVPSLVANGRFHVWWPMEGSMLGGQWNVPSLVANGRWRKNTFSPLPFSPQQILFKPLIFFLWPYGFTLPWF